MEGDRVFMEWRSLGEREGKEYIESRDLKWVRSLFRRGEEGGRLRWEVITE